MWISRHKPLDVKVWLLFDEEQGEKVRERAGFHFESLCLPPVPLIILPPRLFIHYRPNRGTAETTWIHRSLRCSATPQGTPASPLAQGAAWWLGIRSVCFPHVCNLTPCWAHTPPYLDAWSKLLLTGKWNDSHWGRVATKIAAKLPPCSPNHPPPRYHRCSLPARDGPSEEAGWVNVCHWGPGHRAWRSGPNSSVTTAAFLQSATLNGADIINPGLLSVKKKKKLLFPVLNGNESVKCDHFCEMTQIMLMIFLVLQKYD